MGKYFRNTARVTRLHESPSISLSTIYLFPAGTNVYTPTSSAVISRTKIYQRFAVFHTSQSGNKRCIFDAPSAARSPRQGAATIRPATYLLHPRQGARNVRLATYRCPRQGVRNTLLATPRPCLCTPRMQPICFRQMRFSSIRTSSLLWKSSPISRTTISPFP